MGGYECLTGFYRPCVSYYSTLFYFCFWSMVFIIMYFFFSLKVKELDSLLGGSSNRPSRIVWTSSRTSSPSTFSISDIQCEFG